MRRKLFLAGALTVPFAIATARASDDELSRRFASIEAAMGGRLGVAYYVLQTGASGAHRGDERFPMCSTFKYLLAAYVLHRVDHGGDDLDARLPFTSADLQEYAPVSKAHVAEGFLSVRQACAAAVSLSDNTAANLLLQHVGGPPSLTQWLRSVGDARTRLDRKEPELNESLPGDPRDTTTPASMVANVQRLLFANVLTSNSRALLHSWMVQTKTGTTLLRAGFPKTYVIGDKTGTGGPVNAYGDSSTRNDVAFAHDQHSNRTVIVAVYTSGATVAAAARDAAIADVARALVAHLT